MKHEINTSNKYRWQQRVKLDDYGAIIYKIVKKATRMNYTIAEDEIEEGLIGLSIFGDEDDD